MAFASLLPSYDVRFMRASVSLPRQNHPQVDSCLRVHLHSPIPSLSWKVSALRAFCRSNVPNFLAVHPVQWYSGWPIAGRCKGLHHSQPSDFPQLTRSRQCCRATDKESGERSGGERVEWVKVSPPTVTDEQRRIALRLPPKPFNTPIENDSTESPEEWGPDDDSGWEDEDFELDQFDEDINDVPGLLLGICR